MANIHFIGAGQMAEAIIRAAIKSGKVSTEEITIADIDPSRVALLTKNYGLRSVASPEEALAAAELVVIAVRPQDNLTAVSEEIHHYASEEATVISIVAGVTLERLQSLLGAGRPIARVIPNTLTDTGYGYSGVTLNEYVIPERIDGFLNTFGKVLYLEQRLIDIFTGFGVAGPNYIYYFI